jgi:hypothetical protein
MSFLVKERERESTNDKSLRVIILHSSYFCRYRDNWRYWTLSVEPEMSDLEPDYVRRMEFWEYVVSKAGRNTI